VTPSPADYGEQLTCYTAALAVAIAASGETRWWRSQLAGGPVLALSPAGDLVRFEHHATPPLPALGLHHRWAGDWSAAGPALAAELSRTGVVIVLGDVYQLPWQRGHRRWHAPHWFTVVDRPGGRRVDDVLSMTTDLGPQRPSLVRATGELADWAVAVPPDDPVHILREQAVAGHADIGLGSSYRWLEAGLPQPAPGPPSGRLVGADALAALAERFRFAAGPEDYRQADDLWQALRQRELLVRAAADDAGLLTPDGVEHWRRAVQAWRALPPLLLHARMRAEAGASVDTGRVADALFSLCEFEGRHLAAAPEPASGGTWPDRSGGEG